ncbi:hypothetical protein M1307_02395 [Patescibacteria group bacterium]|nr:hypothetical protein [Patescibacteria group bacterium]
MGKSILFYAINALEKSSLSNRLFALGAGDYQKMVSFALDAGQKTI